MKAGSDLFAGGETKLLEDGLDVLAYKFANGPYLTMGWARIKRLVIG